MSDSIMARWEHEAVSITITWGRPVALTRSIAAVVVVIARRVAVRTATAVSVRWLSARRRRRRRAVIVRQRVPVMVRASSAASCVTVLFPPRQLAVIIVVVAVPSRHGGRASGRAVGVH